MPAPPPPPPPPPPPSFSTNSQQLTTQKATGERAMLLNEIHKGTRLKKAVTNDRSAPAVEGKIVGEETKPCAGRTATAPSTVSQKSAAPKPGGAMNLGDLFRDGVPRKPSDLKNQKSSSAGQIVASNTLGRNNGQQKPRSSPVKKAPPVAIASENEKTVENNHSSTPPPHDATANKSTRAAAIANLQKSVSTTAVPAAPPPLPAKLPKQKTTIALQPSKLPLSQHNQFQTLRPTKTQPNSDEKRTPLRRTGSTEEIQKRPSAPPPPPIMRRPGAPPPPPPPLARPPPPKMAPAVKKVEQPMNNGNCSASPPLPPPRVSSYLESMEQRFHFVPLSELPPPPKFVGFRKDYCYLPVSK
ncbi:hypothetical protein niasHS_010250 [Heterodera schachtii]|uniref:WH2 domain-containing protein n=1 Tax=Heterodera schachtii TaxID=97005 RepID=A0ABD2J4N2_HETSC